MESFICVRNEHLNHHGTLFGGQVLLWADEMAWMAASRDFPHTNFVTRALGESLFQKRVLVGSILRFKTKKIKQGTTSVTYSVEVFATTSDYSLEELSFFTSVTLISVNDDGEKSPIVFFKNEKSS
ncbi:MAG: acyl-CoA thioesterase [Treponemataceae bacterium]